MERREMMTAAGALALAAVTANAIAAGEHDHHHMGSKNQALIDAAGDCAAKGDACLAHCLVLLGEGDKVMAACAQSVNQTIAVCSALQRLAAQNSPYLGRFAKLAIDVCADCEKECRKHEKKHAECKACADSCAECIKQCKAFS